MDSKFNAISFCKESYKDFYDCLGKESLNETKLFEDIAAFIKVAIQNGYQMKIWNDGLTIVIEYNHQDESLSGASLEWLGENEYVMIYGEEDEGDK